jgi:alkylhydroperoxidase family enzyme
MPRIPYLQDDQVGPPELVAAIRQRRGGALIHLDRMLLYSPPLAEGWNQMMGRVRQHLDLSPLLRELAMCTVAVLNGADYELHHHAPPYLAAGGTQPQLDALAALRDAPDALAWLAATPLFDTTQRAALGLIVQSTRQVAVDDAVFDTARAELGNDRWLFELVAVVAAYNMVSRVLVALGVQPED